MPLQPVTKALPSSVTRRGLLRSTTSWYAPSRLFVNNEAGVWFDPSDLTTLFQDIDATVPVTAPGQAVARINDKSGRGNHATQATAASRPIYGVIPRTGRRNLFGWSEDMTNAAWAKIYSTATPVPDQMGFPLMRIETAPDVVTANYLGRIQQSLTLPVGTYTWSSIQTANQAGVIVLVVTAPSPASVGGGGSGSRPVQFDTTTQAFTEQGLGTGASYSATNLGGGLWQITLTIQVTAAGTVFFQRCVERNAVLGESAGRFFLAGPTQLEVGTSATPYQRVTTQFDVTEAGVPTLSYLSFDGVDDFLVTPTITPNTDKLQVFAGVRKLSDVAAGTPFMFASSGTFSAGVGIAMINAPSLAGTANFAFSARQSTPATAPASGNASPMSAVLTGSADIAASRTSLRVNGSEAGSSANSLGTGNFGNHPIYVGRQVSPNPFNGLIFGLVSRFGANLDADTISQTEAWLNTKTGAY